MLSRILPVLSRMDLSSALPAADRKDLRLGIREVFSGCKRGLFLMDWERVQSIQFRHLCLYFYNRNLLSQNYVRFSSDYVISLQQDQNLQAQNDRNADGKKRLPGLVMKAAHSKQRSDPASGSCRKDQNALRNTPGMMDCFLLIDAEQRK